MYMNRVCVIGCPGSGKSTFSRALRDITGLPLFYLDMLFHRPDRTTVSREEFDRRLSEILVQDRFILDGNYGRTLERRLSHSDTVFFLDYHVEVCLEGIEARCGKPREDMPWVETEYDGEFLNTIRSFRDAVRPEILRTLSKFPQLQQIVFHSREEAERYLRRDIYGQH